MERNKEGAYLSNFKHKKILYTLKSSISPNCIISITLTYNHSPELALQLIYIFKCTGLKLNSFLGFFFSKSFMYLKLQPLLHYSVIFSHLHQSFVSQLFY